MMKKLFSVFLCISIILSLGVCHASLLLDTYNELKAQVDASRSPGVSETISSADFDLSAMSLEELIELQQQVTMAMWETEEWQEVVVPTGLYRIGKDIPAGHWTISPKSGYADITYGDAVDASLTDITFDGDIYEYKNLQAPEASMSAAYSAFLGEEYAALFDSMYETSWSINMIDGHFILIEDGPVIFAPYAGANLGFKF